MTENGGVVKRACKALLPQAMGHCITCSTTGEK